jgi:SAM-dependent methyltransferase
MNQCCTPCAVTWDYTEHAAHYDKRADYSEQAIDELLAALNCRAGTVVADIGAGTGKLSKELLQRGLTVRSVEPNEAMRGFGIENTRQWSPHWSVGTGETTGLESHSVECVFFGSSFNVVDQRRTLTEVARILTGRGWFACLWNHRDLDEALQREIEATIKRSIPGYSYGSRREDPTEVINQSGYFGPVSSVAGSFHWPMWRADIIEAWRSHATLRRQTDERTFDAIVARIAQLLRAAPEPVQVPYTTRAYFAQARVTE